MRERGGRLVDGKYGTFCEIETDSGHRYRFGNLVYKTRNHVAVFDGDDRIIGREKVEGDHPLLDEIFDVMEDHGNFDGAHYRALFARHGLDPDNGRPAFNDWDRDVVRALEWKSPWPGTDGRSNYRLNELGNDLSELLRIDQRPDLQAYFECQRELETWEDVADKLPFETAFDRIDVTRLMSRKSITVEIDLLPSRVALEDHRLIEPRLYIEMWSNLLGQDDQGFPSNFPTTLAGIAVEPEMHDESDPGWEHSSSWYKVGNLAAHRVRDRLERQGVVFLGKVAAAAYLRSDEAVYWCWMQRDNDAWWDPAYKHLTPRAATSAEEAKWRVNKPETPLSDRSDR
ncbi:MAG: hypothetical protein WBA25_16285 [Jannaschia sp.]